MYRRGAPLKERFEHYIFYSPDGCWYWTAKADVYGRIQINGKGALTHRVSYELYKGPIPEGLCVLHTCDNPLCVNPDHLWLGTYKDNRIDTVRKNRHAKGTNAKITLDDVLKIRQMKWASGRAIGKIFGISSSAVNLIRSGITWKNSLKK